MGVNLSQFFGKYAKPINLRPLPTEKVTVKECGNITDVTFCQKTSYGGVTKKLDKDTYIDTRDGTVKEFKHHEKRLDDIKSVMRTLKNGRDMINANVTDVSKWRMITLTYAENMTDTKKLYNDFKNFWHKEFCPSYPTADRYINAVEPQERGAWHIHLLAGFSDVAPFLPNEHIRALWKHGFVTIRPIDNVDNVGAYLSGYLSNMPIDEAQRLNLAKNGKIINADTLDDNGKPIKKKVVKGARMHLYPAGMRIFRCSRNCIKPNIYKCTSDEADKLVKDHTLVYENTIVIEDIASGFSNIVNKRTYNKLRKEAKSDNN